MDLDNFRHKLRRLYSCSRVSPINQQRVHQLRKGGRLTKAASPAAAAASAALISGLMSLWRESSSTNSRSSCCTIMSSWYSTDSCEFCWLYSSDELAGMLYSDGVRMLGRVAEIRNVSCGCSIGYDEYTLPPPPLLKLNGYELRLDCVPGGLGS